MLSVAPRVEFKQFRILTDSKADACLSYVVFDPRSRECMIIDPHADAFDDYCSFIAENSLKLTVAIDTQTHWGYLSASHLLRSRFGCDVAMSDRTTSQRVTRKLSDRDRFRLGEVEFEVLQTPGVSPDAIVIKLLGMLWTGNTLWAHACAPSCFPGSDPVAHWNSLQLLKEMDESLLVLPGYDCNDLIFSTIAVEKSKNSAWKQTKAEFADWAKSFTVVVADVFVKIHEANLMSAPSEFRVSRLESVFGSAGKSPDEGLTLSAVTSINTDKYLYKVEEKSPQNIFVDVRERDEYREGHISGTVNWPMTEVGLHLPEIAAKKRVYVSCLAGKRSSLVARTLSYLGFTDVVNVTGGFKAWQNAGYPVAK